MEQVKPKLNVLIEYYRKQIYLETKDKEFSKELFSTVLVDGKQETICSPTSYRKMVNGESLKNDTIYDLLLEKLGYEYSETAYVYTADFEENCLLMVRALEEERRSTLVNLIKSCLNKMNSNDLVENEYCLVLESLLRFYDEENNEDHYLNFQRILDLFLVYNETIKQCLSTPLYNYCIISNQEERICFYYSNIEKTPYHQSNLLYYSIDENIELDKVEEEMMELLQYYESVNNKNMMLRLLTMKMKYYYWIGKDSDTAVREIDDFIHMNQQSLNRRTILNYKYFKAKKYNREKEYGKAKESFDELLREDKKYFSNILGYYFNCLVQLDETVKFEEELIDLLDERSCIIYKYFQIPKLNYIERENYILKSICTKLILSHEYVAKSFLYELRRVVRTTKHYSLLEQYLEKTDDFL